MSKPPVSAWIAAQRKAKRWKSEELAERLTAAGYPVAVTTVRTWEASRRPSPENIAALERLFDATAPADRPDDDDLRSLVRLLVEELRAEREARVEWERGFLEAMRALATGAAPLVDPATEPHGDVAKP
jgi:transcriptional regulator with XRE-family HTH domain